MYTGNNLYTRKIPIKGIVIACVFLFIGILIIQSTGCFNSNSIDNLTANTVETSSEYDEIEEEVIDNSDQGSNEKEGIDDSTKTVIYNFIDQTKQRYPELDQLGKDMGINKKRIINIIETLGCEKIVSSYISFFGSIFS